MPPATPIHITPEIHVHLGGDLHVHGPDDAAATVDRTAVIREFLEMVDPAALEAAALTRIDVSSSVVVAMLNVLHEQAGELDGS